MQNRRFAFIRFRPTIDGVRGEVVVEATTSRDGGLHEETTCRYLLGGESIDVESTVMDEQATLKLALPPGHHAITARVVCTFVARQFSEEIVSETLMIHMPAYADLGVVRAGTQTCVRSLLDDDDGMWLNGFELTRTSGRLCATAPYWWASDSEERRVEVTLGNEKISLTTRMHPWAVPLVFAFALLFALLGALASLARRSSAETLSIVWRSADDVDGYRRLNASFSSARLAEIEHLNQIPGLSTNGLRDRRGDAVAFEHHRDGAVTKSEVWVKSDDEVRLAAKGSLLSPGTTVLLGSVAFTIVDASTLAAMAEERVPVPPAFEPPGALSDTIDVAVFTERSGRGQLLAHAAGGAIGATAGMLPQYTYVWWPELGNYMTAVVVVSAVSFGLALVVSLALGAMVSSRESRA